MLIRIVKTALMVAAFLLLACVSWFVFEFTRAPAGAPERIVFEVSPGQSARDIAQALQKKGILPKTWPFLIGYRLMVPKQSLKAGEYAFQIPLSAKAVLGILTQGSVYLHSVTIPEGLILEEIGDLLEETGITSRSDFLRASQDTSLISSFDETAQNLEGYLFPETYRFAKGTPAEEVVEAMVSQFLSVFTRDWRVRAEEIGLSVREVVTLASLIEKETSLPEEKPIISAVFHNRLKIGMKLDCDPTIIYVLKKNGTFTGRLRTRDMKLDSPYNTYLYGGLPPGPIANPGRASLEAALYPSDEDYLYFVSKNDGSHHFSRSFREHQNAVNRYQKRSRRP
ncbi:MAG: endolytic transglycosylase MltG [Candidatus Aminicenantales bacterium]